jgi:thioesterase domain-containing protein/acyl carrier protein
LEDWAHTTEELRAFLKARLPDHMIPAAFVRLEALPLAPSGKVDLRALPASPPRTSDETQRWRPGDYIEAGLVDIWETLLKVYDFGPRDSFFDLGGHSLLALTAISRICETLGVEIPIETFFSSPTIEELTGLIRHDWVPRAQRSLVKVADADEGRPFFCVHGGPGDVAFLKDLVTQVDFGRPVYGLRAVGMDGLQKPLTSVEAMASCYLAELRDVQPAGPYLLAGNCDGGLVAFEMARRLCAEGEQATFLGLFDTGIPTGPLCEPEAETDTGAAGNGSKSVADRIIAEARERQLADLRADLLRWGMSHLLDEEVLRVERTGQALPNLFHRLADIAAGFFYAARTYALRPYPGHATLFKATEDDCVSEDLEAQWRRLVQGLEVFGVRAKHTHIGESKELGVRLRACLDAVAPVR